MITTYLTHLTPSSPLFPDPLTNLTIGASEQGILDTRHHKGATQIARVHRLPHQFHLILILEPIPLTPEQRGAQAVVQVDQQRLTPSPLFRDRTIQGVQMIYKGGSPLEQDLGLAPQQVIYEYRFPIDPGPWKMRKIHQGSGQWLIQTPRNRQGTLGTYPLFAVGGHWPEQPSLNHMEPLYARLDGGLNEQTLIEQHSRSHWEHQMQNRTWYFHHPPALDEPTSVHDLIAGGHLTLTLQQEGEQATYVSHHGQAYDQHGRRLMNVFWKLKP
jgi:hypothetical protein